MLGRQGGGRGTPSLFDRGSGREPFEAIAVIRAAAGVRVVRQIVRHANVTHFRVRRAMEAPSCQDCATAQLDYTVPKETMFGDHTYFLDGNGLNIVEPSPAALNVPSSDIGEMGVVVNIANWTGSDPPKLEVHEPERTDSMVSLAADGG